MRRQKRILKKFFILAIAIGIILLVYFAFFKKIKNIDSGNNNNDQNQTFDLEISERPKVEIILPEKIYESTSNTTVESKKTYKPIVSDKEIEQQKKYLETITNEREITIMLGDDAQELLPENSPIVIGESYKVSGIEEPMKTTYAFTIDGYKYPIILAQTQSGHLQFIDAEEAFQTGVFRIKGQLADIENVDRIYETNAEQNGKTTKVAIISLESGEGYEFNLKMINK